MTPGVRLLAVPYDSGHRAARLGAGPDRLLAAGLADHLGRPADVERIESADPFPLEVVTSFGLIRRLADAVRAAAAAGRFPLTVAGNCMSAVGTLAGLTPGRVGVIWLDCHGDFNTPETTPTGFLDGMAVAAVAGLCWPRLVAAVPGFRPVPANRVIHLGGRDFDPGEREEMTRAGVAVVDAAAVRRSGLAAALAPAVEALAADADAVYFHTDLDVLDPAEAPANGYQKPGGLSVGEVEEAVRLVRARLPFRAAALTAYDPTVDPDGRTPPAALRLARCLADAGGG
jgi:arginase